MDKPQIVCCAVFLNQDQGIKISYWSFSLENTFSTLYFKYYYNSYFSFYYVHNIKFWGIEVLWVQMTEPELTRLIWMLKLLMVQNLLLLFKCTRLMAI